MTTFNR